MIQRLPRSKQSSKVRILTGPFIHIIIIAGAIVMIYPIIWLLSASFKPMDEIFSSTSLLPQSWTFDNYPQGWTALDYSFDVFFVNSFLVCLGAVIGNVVSCSLAAYAFARVRLRLKAIWFTIMLGTIMLPYNVIVVPQYVLFKNFGWINSFLPLIVPKFLATDAFFIFLLVQFIRAIPHDLDDAAKIDATISRCICALSCRWPPPHWRPPRFLLSSGPGAISLHNLFFSMTSRSIQSRSLCALFSMGLVSLPMDSSSPFPYSRSYPSSVSSLPFNAS
jgi:hypothetical protein